MRICVIYKGELRRKNSFVVSRLGSFRGAEIYKTEYSDKLSARRRLKCLRELKSLGISFAATDGGDFPRELLAQFGITVMDGTRAKASRIAEMALLFAEREMAPLSFFIRGGSFRSVLDAVLPLLRITSDVSVSCADFAAVAEACAEACGAVIRDRPSGTCVKISPAEKDALLSFGEKTLGFSDFSLSLAGVLPLLLPAELTDGLASILETCGILRYDEVTVQNL